MKETEYYSCGDGECQFAKRCVNAGDDLCYVCCYNTGATPRSYFSPKSERLALTEEEQDMIES